MPSHKLTKPQRQLAEKLFERSYVFWWVHTSEIAKHQPMHKLEELGLCFVGYGPAGSWLKTQCYLAKWSDPVV